MSLKTDYCVYTDNFVECDGKLQELTVTITLSEYRHLVQAVERYEMANKRLQEANEKLKAEKKSLQDAMLACQEEAEPEATELTAALKGE